MLPGLAIISLARQTVVEDRLLVRNAVIVAINRGELLPLPTLLMDHFRAETHK
jgi:hypothetical protein